jgi:hypothetical protein
MRVVDECERLWIMVSRGDISAKYLIKNQPNATSKISQTPYQKTAKRHIKNQPNATSKISQTPHLADKKNTHLFVFQDFTTSAYERADGVKLVPIGCLKD